MNANTPYRLTLLAAAFASLTLVACSKPDDNRTAGQKLDEGIAKVEQKTDAAAAKTEAQLDKLGDKVTDAANKTEVAMADAAITASIKAELARDPGLSALSINVDTKEGLVSLKGTAPDAMAKDRATRLAAAVKGVLSVDNHLVVNG
jgi:hyperosmotically inducible protein